MDAGVAVGLAGIAVTLGLAALSAWRRPRLVAEAEGVSIVLKNRGRRTAEDVDVRVVDAEPPGVVLAGGPYGVSRVMQVNEPVRWPTGAFRGLVPARGEDRLKLCNLQSLERDGSDCGMAVLNTASGQAIEVQASPRLAQFVEESLSGERLAMIKAPAQIRFEVRGRNVRTRRYTLHLDVPPEVPPEPRAWWAPTTVEPRTRLCNGFASHNAVVYIGR